MKQVNKLIINAETLWAAVSVPLKIFTMPFPGGSARDAGLVRYGHGSKYYRDIGKRAEETLANYGALSVVRPDLIEMLRKDKPELVEALEEVIQDMLKKAGG